MAAEQIRERFRNRKRVQKKRRRPVNVLASLITTFNLYCGIASIFASINGEHDHAAYWIIAAIVMDMADGAVARLTNSVSDFGKELDSLSDIVSFGAAPCVLIYTAYLMEDPTIGPSGSMVAIIYVICGALRLARYNSYQTPRSDIFYGLPIPGAAGMVASFVLFTNYFEWNVAYWMLGPLTVALAFMMVSSIEYPKKNLQVFLLAPRRAFQFLVLCVVAIGTIHYARQYSPSIVFLPLGIIYVGYGLINHGLKKLQAFGLLGDFGASIDLLDDPDDTDVVSDPLEPQAK